MSVALNENRQNFEKKRDIASPKLNFNLGFFFLRSKALSWIIFSALFTASIQQIVDSKEQIKFAF